jgi:hypothetical protein
VPDLRTATMAGAGEEVACGPARPANLPCGRITAARHLGCFCVCDAPCRRQRQTMLSSSSSIVDLQLLPAAAVEEDLCGQPHQLCGVAATQQTCSMQQPHTRIDGPPSSAHSDTGCRRTFLKCRASCMPLCSPPGQWPIQSAEAEQE